MIPILYPADSTEWVTNGIGRLAECTRCEVTEERNGIYEVEMDVPITARHYPDITEGMIVSVIHDDTKTRQPFVIYRRTAPIDGIVTFYAHHISYRLSGIVVQPFEASTIADAFRMLTQKSMTTNPFTFTTDKGSEGAFKVEVPTGCRQLLGGTDGSILDAFGGGEYEFDNFIVRLWQNRGQDTGVQIRYGKNLADIEKDFDISGAVGGIVGYWKGGTEEDPVLVSTPVIYASGYASGASVGVVDFSGDFQTEPTVEQLTEKVNSYILTNKPFQPNLNITVDFVSLWQTKEYESVAALQRVRLCDTVTVIYNALGVNEAKIKVTKVVYDALNERYTEIELGSLKTSLAGMVLKTARQDIKDGRDGTDGKGVSEVIIQHCLASSREIPEGGSFDDIQVTEWTEVQPVYVEGRFIWSRTVTIFTDGTTLAGDPYFDMVAQTAGEASALAQTANGAAEDAQEIADNALGKIETMENHFWYNSGGAHIAENAGDLSTGASQTLSSHGSVLMHNGKLVVSLTGGTVSKAALNFYNGTNAQAVGDDLMATFNKSGVGLFVYNEQLAKAIRAMALTASGLTFYTPDADHNTQAIYGPTGINLYALGKLAMALATGSIKFYDTDGSTVLAEFGTDGAQIGKDADSHMDITEKEISATADDGAKYFSLLNVAGGTVEARYTGVSQSDAYYVYGLARRADIESVTVDGVKATYALTWSSLYNAFYVTISSPSVSGKTIVIRYAIGSDVNGKSFTFGTRSAGSGFAGGYSASFGEGHIVTGECSFASGIGNISPWAYGASFGKYNSYYSGLYYGAPLFCVGNGTSETSRSNALSVDADGNMQIGGELYARKAFMRMVTSSSGSTVSNAANRAITTGVTLTAKGEGFNTGSFFITPGITGYYRVTVAGYWSSVAETVNLSAVPPVVPKRVRWFGLGIYNPNDATVTELMLTGGRDASYETRSATDIVHINNGQYLVVIARDEAITGSATATLGTTKITAELVWPD